MDKKMNYYGPGADAKGGMYPTAAFPGANFAAAQPAGYTAAAMAPGTAPATHRHVAVTQSAYAPSAMPGSATAYTPTTGVYSALTSPGYPSSAQATGAFHSPAHAQALQYQQLQQQGLIAGSSPTGPTGYTHSQYPAGTAYITGTSQLGAASAATGYPVGIAVTNPLQYSGLGAPVASVPGIPGVPQRYATMSQMGYPASLASNPNYPNPSPYGGPYGQGGNYY